MAHWRGVSDQREASEEWRTQSCLHCRTQLPSRLQTMPAEMAATTGAKGKLRLEPRGSKFQKFQELKLQELAEEVCLNHGLPIQAVMGT